MDAAVIYIRRPQIAAAFQVDVEARDSALRISGAQLADLTRFLRSVQPESDFDIEVDGKLYGGCRLVGPANDDGCIYVKSARTSELPPFRSRLNTDV